MQNMSSLTLSSHSNPNHLNKQQQKSKFNINLCVYNDSLLVNRIAAGPGSGRVTGLGSEILLNRVKETPIVILNPESIKITTKNRVLLRNRYYSTQQS